jgi:[ribosomal protein S5]-alanine N-acetyltransferase
VRSRINITPPVEADRDAFLAAMRASRSVHRPWISMPETAAEYAAYLERSRRDTSAFFLARRHDDDAIVGFLNISEIVRGPFQSAFLGYGGVAGFDGQGYMREALDLVLREAFTKLGLHRLEANIQPQNTASIALVRRSGFELEGYSPRYLKIGGRWRDHERWAIRAETWRARRRRMIDS